MSWMLWPRPLGPGGFSALAHRAERRQRTGYGGSNTNHRQSAAWTWKYTLTGNPALAVCALLEAGRSEAASALIAPDGTRLREDRITGI